MGSEPIHGSDNPSPPTSILPRLRSSRHGSLASLSNATHFDRETLAHVLDQIHTEACQSENLTTFNEYTSPPPSSSGTDSKGVASELQGGLSGLYTKFRASVGNVKDIVKLGGEEAEREAASVKSPKKPSNSPASSMKSRIEIPRATTSSVVNVPSISPIKSIPHSPVNLKLSDPFSNEQAEHSYRSTLSEGSVNASSKIEIGSPVVLKYPPASSTQIPQPTTIAPTLAEVNIGAFNQQEVHSQSSDPQHVASSSTQERKQNLSIPLPQGESPHKEIVSHFVVGQSNNGTLKSLETDSHKKKCSSPPTDGLHEALQDFNRSHSKKVDKAERDHNQKLEDQMQQSSSIEALNSGGVRMELKTESAKSSFDMGRTMAKKTRNDVSESSDHPRVEQKSGDKGIYQHLELPLRKGLTSPQAVRTHSSKPNVTRASVTEKNAELLVDANTQDLSDQYSAIIAGDARKTPQFMGAADGRDSDRRITNVSIQAKNRILDKQYWMRDENARDCFYCGDPFSTFRRKHHCRTCGQIFDSKCTSLIPGKEFGQAGTLRVCKPCEAIISGEDDSSDVSDDGTLSIRGMRPRHGSTAASDILATPIASSSPDKTKTVLKNRKVPALMVPTMSIPATRKTGGESNRKTPTLEIDAERVLMRPSSSRSLKSSYTSKPYHSAHRRHNSRQILQRGFKTVNEDNAPFHQSPVSDDQRLRPLPAFHDDNIIDPDLAPYLSDDGSSGDEQISIMAAMSGNELSRSHDHDKHGFGGLIASAKKARSKMGDKSNSGIGLASRDVDNHSLSSLNGVIAPRSSKRRNLSVTGNLHLKPSPRGYRLGPAIPNFDLHLSERVSGSKAEAVMPSTSTAGGSRMIRSSSMRGAAAPAVELNNASLRHVRKLLHQLLQESQVLNVARWERALMPILLKATDDVNPDVQHGDDMDIRHYVKLKKVPGGRPGDTSYVSGLVFTKNLALKSMPRTIPHPNILVLTFPLEYSRHHLQFMSLEPVIRQEREFLENLVNRIAALRPHVLLVERNVSGLALEFLERANIATAYNVKISVLEAVSRCCQTKIISSIDKLAIKPAQAGKCASFYLKTYVNGCGKKTYMFLSGCAKELGCTIVLRGGDDRALAKMKRVTEFMLYVVYNLKLETCLMRDEFASIPSTTEIGTLSTGKDFQDRAFQTLLTNAKDQSKHANHSAGIEDANNTSNTGAVLSNVIKSQGTEDSEADKGRPSLAKEDSVPDDIPMPTFYGDMVEAHKTRILSASPFVKFVQPYLLMRAREQERRLAYLKRLRDQDIVEEQILDEKAKPEKFDLIKPEMVHERIHTASKKVREVLHAVHDAEYDKALHNYQTQSKQWETHISLSLNLLDPYAHQNIAVLYSLVCTATTIPCSGPDILAFDFYNENDTDIDFEADCTLGQYVEDLCLGVSTVCTANGCERKMSEHHRQYVHGEAQLSCIIEQHPCKLRGLEEIILMWSVCRRCNKETQVLPMSESTWKYSFGKYLELSFWCSNLRARADVCPHDLHRDHLRYFGFKDMALRIQYDPITIAEIIVPRARITWKVDNDLRFKNELFTKIEDRLNKFILSVKARIKSINTESVLPNKVEDCQQEIEKLSKRASEEHAALTRHLRDQYMNSKHYEVIPFNRAIRAVQENAAGWDSAFSSFDDNFFPSEKDIRRLATLQLKKIFLDREDSLPLVPSEDGTITPVPEEGFDEKTVGNESPELNPQTRHMSPEKTNDMLAAVVEKHVSSDSQPDQQQSAPSIGITKPQVEDNQRPHQQLKRADIRHLDLAMPPDSSQILRDSQESDQFMIRMTDNVLSNEDSTHRAGLQQPGRRLNSTINNPSSDNAGVIASLSGKPAESSQPSSIPRPADTIQRNSHTNTSPVLSRTRSQPVQVQKEECVNNTNRPNSPTLQISCQEGQSYRLDETLRHRSDSMEKPVDRKLSNHLGHGIVKQTGVNTHSMIPRSITYRTKDSNVSNLAKHFEQLSREFEKERIRERRQRVAKSRQASAYPTTASKPIVHVYRNVHEAVEEKEPSDEHLFTSESNQEFSDTVNDKADSTPSHVQSHESFHTEETTAENTEIEDNNIDSNVGSDLEGEGTRSDEEQTTAGDEQAIKKPDEQQAFSSEEAPLDMRLDLPKHEKSSLMKILTNFWAERSASGWQPLEYPLNPTDHIFADSDIIVREDEPSSLIAFALNSEDYQAKLRSIISSDELSNEADENAKPRSPGLDPDQSNVKRSLLRPMGKHLKYQFAEGSAKMLCKVFYAEQFDALRRKCGVAERIVESLSRCMKWDSKGGKTKSVFLKTLDDRFVLKSLSLVETQAFLQFAPGYFYIMSRFLFHDMPSVIAKMVGFYQITIKNPATGVDFNWSLLVMENLFYDRSPTRTFDLKGSMRNRRIQSTGEQNEVLLDENMVDFIYATPLFSREHSKKLLRASVFNDTLFLAKHNVMDYSLMVAIDEDRKELVVGIIDCIRTYTWDKKLETWIKDRGKNRPTVTSPKEYKSRFREAMSRYVLQAPNCWHHFNAQPVGGEALKVDEQGDDREVHLGGL